MQTFAINFLALLVATIVKTGTGEELLHDPAVKDAYLGVA